MTRSNLTTILLLLVLCFPNLADAQPPTVEVIDGVRQIHNGAEPRDGERTLQLEETWRVNVEEEEELIGVISAAISGPDGTVWLTDHQLGQVLVYSADGEHLKTLSREGEGPGEVDHPDDLFWLPDGNLGIKDRKSGQFTRIDQDGIPQSSIHLRDEDGESLASGWLNSVRCRGGILAVCGNQFGNDEDGTPRNSRFFSIFDLEGQEVAQLMEAPSGFDFGNRTFDERKNWFVSMGQYDIDAAGRVHFAAERDRYLIHVNDATGRQVAVIERDYEPRRRSDEEIADLADNVSMNINGESVKLDCDFLDTAAAIEDIHILDDGTMWVKNGHGDESDLAGVVRSFDVFDADGQFVEVVHLELDMDDDNDVLYPLDDGRWILVENLAAAWDGMYGTGDEADEDPGEDAAVEIVCLRGRP